MKGTPASWNVDEACLEDKLMRIACNILQLMEKENDDADITSCSSPCACCMPSRKVLSAWVRNEIDSVSNWNAFRIYTSDKSSQSFADQEQEEVLKLGLRLADNLRRRQILPSPRRLFDIGILPSGDAYTIRRFLAALQDAVDADRVASYYLAFHCAQAKWLEREGVSGKIWTWTEMETFIRSLPDGGNETRGLYYAIQHCDDDQVVGEIGLLLHSRSYGSFNIIDVFSGLPNGFPEDIRRSLRNYQNGNSTYRLQGEPHFDDVCYTCTNAH